jgi:hypothetical protein
MAPVTVMWSFVTDVHAWGPLWSPIRRWCPCRGGSKQKTPNPNPWIYLAKKKRMFVILSCGSCDRNEGLPWRPWQSCGPL